MPIRCWKVKKEAGVEAVAPPSLTPESLVLIGETRLSRTLSEFEYRVKVRVDRTKPGVKFWKVS